MREANLLENWIVSREPVLNDEKLGESISQVEELIRRHEDFEKTIEAHADKFSAIRRITLVIYLDSVLFLIHFILHKKLQYKLDCIYY